MNRGPFSSSPPSQPSPYRYLGRGGGERPVRLQIVIALVAGLIIVAVPLYLWRRPRPESIPSADAAIAADGGLLSDAVAPVVGIPDAGPEPVSLSPFNTLRCENPGPGKTPPERCDHVTFFEDALSRAIRENVVCAPTNKSSYKVSFVFEMDFRRKKTNIFVGKSSTIRRDKTKELIRCIKRAIPKPDWDRVPHQYSKYKINIIATYPGSEM